MLNGTRAVILAAGIASRLRPYTESLPKPLVELNGSAMLHNARHQLSALGIVKQPSSWVIASKPSSSPVATISRMSPSNMSIIPCSISDRQRLFSMASATPMLAGDTVFLEGDVFFEREVFERTLQTVSPTMQSAAAVASFKASMTGSVVELAEDGSVATFFMHQTPIEPQARGLFKGIDPTCFCGVGLREHLAPPLQGAVESGHRTAYVDPGVPCGKPRTPAFDDRLQRYTLFEFDSEDDLHLAERMFAPPGDLILPAATLISLAAGARR
ncbi:NTP transferase domain-containing protein [Bradyrhizobium algeriense]|uniref:NTP transferase domain-containing protein n=1 Tax=Bradyrhizobium algeriense TaxID=634784 RepID=UPI000D3A8A91|nr:NTP transferase domain-containing protein [Bradyrhizobium algeriense]